MVRKSKRTAGATLRLSHPPLGRTLRGGSLCLHQSKGNGQREPGIVRRRQPRLSASPQQVPFGCSGRRRYQRPCAPFISGGESDDVWSGIAPSARSRMKQDPVREPPRSCPCSASATAMKTRRRIFAIVSAASSSSLGIRFRHHVLPRPSARSTSHLHGPTGAVVDTAPDNARSASAARNLDVQPLSPASLGADHSMRSGG